MTVAPHLATDDTELHEQLDGARATPGRQIVLVPTMGALHEGHASLLRTAREAARDDGLVVASVFVNPLQFGAGEDLDRYPRTFDADLELCAREGVDVVFAPPVDVMYPDWPAPPTTTLDPGPLGDVLEGRSRPGHFRGVLTVVATLFGHVAPTGAVFGEKDYQQLVLIGAMARQLMPGVRLVGAETAREPDGLALSSRNRYLDVGQRRDATVLHRALRAAQDAGADGVAAALAAAHAELAQEPSVDVDYLVVTDPDLGALPPDVSDGARGRVLVAARVGSTRLIDNLPIRLGAAER